MSTKKSQENVRNEVFSSLTTSVFDIVNKSKLTEEETKWAVRQVLESIYDLGKKHGKEK